MNPRDTVVAKGLLFVIAFTATFFIVDWLLSYLLPGFADPNTFVIYAISAAIAIAAGIAAVRHFFPEP